MRLLPLQIMTITLLLGVLGLQIAGWFRAPRIEVTERVIVEAPSAEVVAEPMPCLTKYEPGESRRVVEHVIKQLAQCREGRTIELRVHVENVETFRSVKMRLADDWHVWVKVPPLMESWVGDFDLVLVPKKRAA